MAAALCNLSPGSDLKRLNDYLLHENYTTRYYLDSKRSACFFCNGGKLSLGTYRRQLKVKKRHQARRVLLAGKEDNSGAKNEEHKEDDVAELTLINEEQKEDNVSKATLIWRAVKLPIYSVALVPLSVGSAAAFFQMGICSAQRYFVLLASSVLIITWLNLSNDVYDYDTGVDKDKQESVVNLVGWRTGTLIAAYLFLGLGFMGLTWASVEAGSIRSIILLACAITCGYIYQCPPFRLGYQGLGEPLCFAAFGPFATTAFYLLQGSTSVMNYLPLSGTILSASVLVGLTTVLILFCSHFHQVEGDMAVGKMSPLVRLGTRGGSKVVKVAVIALYFFLFAFGLIKALPFPSVLLCASTLPIGKMVVRFVEDNHKDKEKIFMAKYYCVRLHALFGTALASGLVVARMINKGHVQKLIFS